jgi:hypothetical protein
MARVPSHDIGLWLVENEPGAFQNMYDYVYNL